jgi:exonuclease III
LRIISWNCNGAFRNKFRSLEKFNADILIVQECEDPLMSKEKDYKDFAKNYLWIGDNKNKGLGIFAKESIRLEPLEWSSVFENHEVKYFLPIRINEQQKLVATWAHYNNSPTFGYIVQFWKFLQINKTEINDTIFIGDFNSNSMWDSWDRWWNHSDIVKTLGDYNINSAYHSFYKGPQGEETQMTFFLNKNPSKGYHIDYCFLPYLLLDNLQSVAIGEFEKWKTMSDHSPLIIDFESKF